MAGSVTVAFRFQDGSVECRICDIGISAYWLKSPRCFTGGENFSHEMFARIADCAEKLVPLAPVDYGLIVVDYKAKQLSSMQCYTDLTSIPMTVVQRSSTHGGSKKQVRSMVDELSEAGRLKLRRRGQTSAGPFVKVSDFEGGYGKALELAQGWARDWNGEGVFDASGFAYELDLAIDTAPLNYVRYPDSRDGAMSYQAMLEGVGFSFDDKASSAWSAYISESA